MAHSRGRELKVPSRNQGAKTLDAYRQDKAHVALGEVALTEKSKKCFLAMTADTDWKGWWHDYTAFRFTCTITDNGDSDFHKSAYIMHGKL